ncbi:MAG: MMPL family transporter [Mitsuaria chitosanitabida]|uniref:efflux RND transporter permease subunit n=1 Tax=Roseateles chitosanitabidus TaxID=65048 RepID=UPI001B2B89CA|nr:MMPL family transporter [Roseateles chitosanitabidus]MBO9687551.1 MMPL family transporter [Roseateles chitosanitabidus]
MNASHDPGWLQALARRAEQALFSHRRLWLALFALVTLLLGWQMLQLRPDASLQKMIPARHEYVLNLLRFETELRPLGNTLRIAVEAPPGRSIYDPEYLALLKRVTDEVFYIPGIDRGNLRSLWTPNTLWFEAAEDGLRSGTVMPPGFQGSAPEIETLRANVAKAGLTGSLVANDGRSSVIVVPLVEADPDTGAHLDYGQFSERLETLVRARHETGGARIHIVGFAKLVGDLIHGARSIAAFFALTVLLTALLLQVYSRCWRSTLTTVFCCLLAVVWHLGLVHLMGFGLDPYSMLVPFLTFAIGVSHAVQNINTLAGAARDGADRVSAARRTFSLLFVPGSVALLCDVVGFSTLLVIDIGVIRELAVSASVGVFVIIFTKMFLLPILMSYAGLSPAGLRHARRRHEGAHRGAARIASLAAPRRAVWVVGAAALLACWAWAQSRHLQIGDLDPGAPELRTGSRYNQDTAYLTAHYSTSADVFVVMVRTDAGECGGYPTASTVRRLQWALEETPGVQGTLSLFNVMDQVIAGTYGGNLKWATVTRNRYVSNSAQKAIPPTLFSNDCSMLPVIAYLGDHKADTLRRVSRVVEDFRAAEPAPIAGSPRLEILLAAGNAGIEAATNEVVRAAWLPMLVLVYAIVLVLLLLEFRSLRVALCLLVPLVITSLLCEAAMTLMGLGVKVATLPVIALGVGIGVDYGIYLYNRLQQSLDEGLPLREAYFETLKTTGLAVAFTGITLAAGVLTWTLSEIKFQADMGLLLTFMFLWNMLGAIVLTPALAALMGLGSRGTRVARSASSADAPRGGTSSPTAASAEAARHLSASSAD